MYNLGLMHATGTGTARSCDVRAAFYLIRVIFSQLATSLLKSVAERGHMSGELMLAHNLYEDGNYDAALMRYLILAEMGFEVAQFNAAFLLHGSGLFWLFCEKLTSPLGFSEIFSLQNETQKLQVYQRAFMNWRRSADQVVLVSSLRATDGLQGHSGARVKVGDYLYYGHGVEASVEAAAAEYRSASDAHNPEVWNLWCNVDGSLCHQAMFNLGVMHHFGDGLDRDIHLAKRYYDMALSTSTEAFVSSEALLHPLNNDTPSFRHH